MVLFEQHTLLQMLDTNYRYTGLSNGDMETRKINLFYHCTQNTTAFYYSYGLAKCIIIRDGNKIIFLRCFAKKTQRTASARYNMGMNISFQKYSVEKHKKCRRILLIWAFFFKV